MAWALNAENQAIRAPLCRWKPSTLHCWAALCQDLAHLDRHPSLELFLRCTVLRSSVGLTAHYIMQKHLKYSTCFPSCNLGTVLAETIVSRRKPVQPGV